MKWNWHRHWVLVVAPFLAVIAVVLAVVSLQGPASETADHTVSAPSPGSDRPTTLRSAQDAIEGLLSGDRQQMKAALSPVLAQHLPRDAPATGPPDLHVAIIDWHRAGPFAVATARLKTEGETGILRVGFHLIGERWRITQVGPAR